MMTLGLLEDFLLHEVLEAGLLGHDRVPGDLLNLFFYFFPFPVEDRRLRQGQYGQVPILQVNDPVGMMQEKPEYRKPRKARLPRDR